MKGISLIAVAVVLAATSASAADLGGKKRRGPADDLPEPRAVEYSPALYGFYLGVEGGYQVTSVKPDHPIWPENLGISTDGFVGAVTGGFDTGYNGIKMGLGASAGLSNVGVDFGGGTEGGMDYFAQIFGRAGFETKGGTFIFGKLGYEYQAWSGEGALDGDLDTYWWVLGAGIETPIDHRVKLKIGVDYLIFNDGDGDLTSSELDLIAGNSDAWRAMAGVTYTFGN